MSSIDRVAPRVQALSEPRLRRAIWITLAALAASLLLFGGYYYWDRYVHFEGQSTLQRDVSHLQQEIQANPQSPELRVVLARYYFDNGLYAEALAGAKAVLQAYPDNQNALLVGGEASLRQHLLEPAREYLNRFIAMRKDLPQAKSDLALEEAYYFLGETELAGDRPEKAAPALEAALAISPTDADALYQLGLSFQAQGQPERAVESYLKAVRLVPDFGAVYDGLIQAYVTLGQPGYVAYARGMQALSRQNLAAGLPLLEEATVTLPEFAAAFLGLALANEKTGDLSAALRAIERASTLAPQDVAIRQALGRIQSESANKGRP